MEARWKGRGRTGWAGCPGTYARTFDMERTDVRSMTQAGDWGCEGTGQGWGNGQGQGPSPCRGECFGQSGWLDVGMFDEKNQKWVVRSVQMAPACGGGDRTVAPGTPRRLGSVRPQEWEGALAHQRVCFPGPHTPWSLDDLRPRGPGPMGAWLHHWDGMYVRAFHAQASPRHCTGQGVRSQWQGRRIDCVFCEWNVRTYVR